MPVIRPKDVARGHECYRRAAAALRDRRDHLLAADPQADPTRVGLPDDPADPDFLRRPDVAMAVRYSLGVLEKAVPGPSTELRVPPFAAVKILPGPDSDPHNLTPPDVLEFTPGVWLRLACGITTWAQEKAAGHIDAVDRLDERVAALFPIPE